MSGCDRPRLGCDLEIGPRTLVLSAASCTLDMDLSNRGNLYVHQVPSVEVSLSLDFSFDVCLLVMASDSRSSWPSWLVLFGATNSRGDATRLRRQAIVAEGNECTINGLKVQIKPHHNKD